MTNLRENFESISCPATLEIGDELKETVWLTSLSIEKIANTPGVYSNYIGMFARVSPVSIHGEFRIGNQYIGLSNTFSLTFSPSPKEKISIYNCKITAWRNPEGSIYNVEFVGSSYLVNNIEEIEKVELPSDLFEKKIEPKSSSKKSRTRTEKILAAAKRNKEIKLNA